MDQAFLLVVLDDMHGLCLVSVVPERGGTEERGGGEGMERECDGRVV